MHVRDQSLQIQLRPNMGNTIETEYGKHKSRSNMGNTIETENGMASRRIKRNLS